MKVGFVLSQPFRESMGTDVRVTGLIRGLSSLGVEVHIITPFKGVSLKGENIFAHTAFKQSRSIGRSNFNFIEGQQFKEKARRKRKELCC